MERFTLVITLLVSVLVFLQLPIRHEFILTSLVIAVVVLRFGGKRMGDYFWRNRIRIFDFLRRVGLLPTVSEVGVFVIVWTALLVATTYSFWSTFSSIFTSLTTYLGVFSLLVLGMFFCGLCLSVYHLFSTRAKSYHEKVLIRFLILFTFLSISLATPFYAYQEGNPVYYLLTAWSIFQAFILSVSADPRWSHHAILISDSDAPIKHVYLAILVTTGVVVAMALAGQHWIFASSLAFLVWSYVEAWLQRRSV